jgi:hypothetical protein
MNQGLEVLNLQSVLYLMIQPSMFFHRRFKCVSVWFQNVVSGGMFNPLDGWWIQQEACTLILIFGELSLVSTKAIDKEDGTTWKFNLSLHQHPRAPERVIRHARAATQVYSLLADKIVPSLELFVLLDGVCVWLKDRNSE